MSIEKSMVFELKKIYKNGVFPTNIPEGWRGPCITYYRSSSFDDADLSKVGEETGGKFILSILDDTSERVEILRNATLKMLRGWLFKSIGDESEGRSYITELRINNVQEQWEQNISKHRAIIDLTIYSKGVL